MGQLGVFAELAGILLVLNVAQMWLNQTSKVVLRQGLVHDLLNEWLVPLRAFRLSYVRGMGANPDQRLHADAQHLTELTTDLGIGLLQSTLLLASFIGVLWVLSRDIALSFARPQLPTARLYGLVRSLLRRYGIFLRLACRPPADRPQRRALCSGGGTAFLPSCVSTRRSKCITHLRRRSR